MFFTIRFPSSLDYHSNYHPLVYFIIWEMHGFPLQFLLAREKSNKTHRMWDNLGNWYSYSFCSMGAFFPIRFLSYGILHHLGNAWVSPLISHSIGKCRNIHRIGRAWEIVTHTFPKVWILYFHQITIR